MHIVERDTRNIHGWCYDVISSGGNTYAQRVVSMSSHNFYCAIRRLAD